MLVEKDVDEVARCKGLTADDLLELKILEPAMGSAAFLVEPVQGEAGINVPPKGFLKKAAAVKQINIVLGCGSASASWPAVLPSPA